MVDRWWVEARTFGVLPLDNRPFSELVFGRPRPVAERARYVYYPGAAAVPEMVAVNVRNRDHRIVATVEIPEAGPDGARPRACCWRSAPGWAAGRSTSTTVDPPTSTTSSPSRSTTSRRPSAVPPGRHQVAFVFERTGEHRGVGHLEVDGVEVARGDIPRFTLTKFSVTGAGLTCGYSDGLPVTRRYQAPFRFTGTIDQVVVEVDGPPWSDPETDAEEAMARQ